MADFGLGGATGSKSTPGGYAPNPGTRSKTGYYKTNPVPLLPSPVTPREMERGARNAEYTYRGYQVPEFSNSDLVGLPPNSGMALDGGTNRNQLMALGNTKQNLQRISSWNSAQITLLQKRMVENGWLPKKEVSGRATERTMSAIAFMMQQGNALNSRWTDVMYMGPEKLRQMGGNDVTSSTGTGPGGRDMSPTTNTSTSVDFSTKADARKYLREALANVLGRGPKDGEVDDFLDSLRSKERQNPTTTTQVTTPIGENDSSYDSTTEGGFSVTDAQNFAENYAKDLNPKQAKRYAKAGYEQLLDQLIAGG